MGFEIIEFIRRAYKKNNATKILAVKIYNFISSIYYVGNFSQEPGVFSLTGATTQRDGN